MKNSKTVNKCSALFQIRHYQNWQHGCTFGFDINTFTRKPLRKDTSINHSSPIGIFDSGIGGLTVAKAVSEALPNEHLIYFGDTARVPYGIKSVETVKGYALEIARFLIEQQVKMILIACNTVSAAALKEVTSLAGDIPVLDVITAGASAAFSSGSPKHIGVIGTLATVNSGAYPHALHALNQQVEVTQQACPLLVPLAEEGWTDNEIARATIKHYLQPFEQYPPDVLILGCTHYPLFKKSIGETIQIPGMRIIDSAESIAKQAKEMLTNLNYLNPAGGKTTCYVSDRPQRFKELAERFMGKPVDDVIIRQL